MRKIFGLVVLYISAYASILGLYISVVPNNNDRPWWHWVFLTVATLAVLILIAWDILDHINSSPRSYKDEESINNYMRNWVNSGGRVVIFSRDMSWASEINTKNILISKAERRELTICIESKSALTNELENAGARVIVYGYLHVPRSRFTIVDFEKEGARVAVGEKQHGVHVIQEYRNGEHPYFGVAEDLVKFLVSFDREKR